MKRGLIPSKDLQFEKFLVEAKPLTPVNSIARLSFPPDLSFLAPIVVGDLVRVGRANDGGYVVPLSSIEKADLLISFGVSDDWSFEQHFKRINPRIRIHAYDHTISRTVFGSSVFRGIVKLPFGKASLQNVSRRWDLFSSYNRFFAKEARHFRERVHGSADSGNTVTPGVAFERGSSNRVFLKVDIEGDEYQLVEQLLLHENSIVGMVVEFHETGKYRSLFVESIHSLQSAFEIVHLHANNFAAVGVDNLPDALELTLVKKLKSDCSKKRGRLPLPRLDSRNNPRKPDYQITFDV